jgi:uncharacterized protein YlxW (UPF0749 family)
MHLENRVMRQWKGLLHSLSLLAAGLTLGLLLSQVWQPPARHRLPEPGLEENKLWPSIERLETEQRELKAALAALRLELTVRQQAAAANTDRLRVLRSELERQQFLAGLTPVWGPGVLVTLDDSTASIPPGADPNAYLIHEYDLRDIINLLWMAGSEAIAINDERLVGSSSIYCLGSTVMVNDTRLSPPFFIRAIGNPRVQMDYLRNPSHLKRLKEKQRLYGLRFDTKSIATLALPAYTGGVLVQHARPGD